MNTFNPQQPLAVYVHLPWCVEKCPYCDFNSHALKNSQLSSAEESRYIEALITDLQQEILASPAITTRPISSIFFGGGTPSLFSPQAFEQFLTALKAEFTLLPNTEITLEANPGTYEQTYFAGFLAAGINRLSIGVQSFANQQLKALGRIHTGEEALAAIENAQQLGFSNINLDLMHGLPNQNLEAALEDLRLALSFQPQHLSWYQLTLEPNTYFHRYPPKLPEEDTLAAIQDAGAEVLAAAGYNNYEVSAFALAGKQAQHNLNYWRFGDYLGLGAGAHGKLTSLQKDGSLLVTRKWKTRQPASYIKAGLAAASTSVSATGLIASTSKNQTVSQVAGTEVLTQDALILEFMLNALRLKDGVELETFQQTTGLSPTVLASQIERLQSLDLWTANPQRLATSPLGWRFLNRVLEEFMVD